MYTLQLFCSVFLFLSIILLGFLQKNPNELFGQPNISLPCLSFAPSLRFSKISTHPYLFFLTQFMFFTKGIALGGSNTSNDLGCTMQKIQLLSNPFPTPSKFPLSRFLTRTQIDLWFSTFSLGFLIVQLVKNPPAMQETLV